MKACILDLETNKLENPDIIWLAGFKCIETGKTTTIFRPDINKDRFINECGKYDVFIGHNIIYFDYDVLNQHSLVCFPVTNCIDTLVISRLLDFKIEGGHSLEAWGQRLGEKKLPFSEFDKYTPEMEEYLCQDLEVNYKLYRKFEPILYRPEWRAALRLEHDMAHICRDMHNNGFGFNIEEARKLHSTITQRIEELDAFIRSDFPSTVVAVKEVNPKVTKHGTLSLTDFRWEQPSNLHWYSPDAPFTRIEFTPFNPNSTKQIIDKLTAIGWFPTDKTKGHIQAERSGIVPEKFYKYGWKINDNNLSTVSEGAPEAIKKLVERLLLDARRSTLVEWLNAYREAPRAIQGHFNSIGAWTHRMSHTEPNQGNIPAKDKLYSKEFRSLWRARNEDRLLIGVDAESIQLRIFAHYINDPEFTESLLTGEKSKGTDPHSINKQVLGSVCKTRDDSKTFLYAFLLGAAAAKAAEILKCSLDEAKEAIYNFINRYTGLRNLKKTIIPRDAKRGYFEGFDGRRVLVNNPHLVLAGYLQNGEATIMKWANRRWRQECTRLNLPYWQVNFVHDEWQTETINDINIAREIASIQCQSIKEAGEHFKLNCPMAGSIINKHGEESIGRTWSDTH